MDDITCRIHDGAHIFLLMNTFREGVVSKLKLWNESLEQIKNGVDEMMFQWE